MNELEKVETQEDQSEFEFQKYFDVKIIDIRDLKHKGNNKLFEIVDEDAQRYLVKVYSDRVSFSDIREDEWSRGEREFKTISYLWEKNFREIPRPIFFDSEAQIGVYSFERGRIIKQEEIKKEHVDHMIEFLIKLSKFIDPDKDYFPVAISGCLNMQQYLDVVKQRFEKINDGLDSSIMTPDIRSFLDDIYLEIKKIEEKFLSELDEKELTEEISLHRQVLTPGDYGFHNILVDEYGEYKFLDFEYFGRDDPTRQILDLKHHAQMNEIDDEMKDYFVKRYMEELHFTIEQKKRLKLIEPLIQITWVLIYLNVLSKEYIEKIKEAHGDIEGLIEGRMIKAKKKFLEFATIKLDEDKKKSMIEFEEEIRDLCNEDQVNSSFVHLCGGNEDQLIEIFKDIKTDDYVFSSHRSHYHYLLKGGESEKLKNMIKEGRSMHIMDNKMNFIGSAIVAGNVSIAVGVAIALKRDKKDSHVWCFIGDGGEDEGHFYEAVRYVEGWDLPCTFIIEDNDRSVKTAKQDRYNHEMNWGDFKCVKRYHYTPNTPHEGTEQKPDLIGS